MTTFEILNNVSTSGHLEFLVIGGHAVNAYGYSRFTEDVDILINRDDRLVWLKGLETGGFSLFRDGGVFLQMTATADNDPLDLMLVKPETLNKLKEGSKAVSIGGLTMHVPSLENLLALKFHVLKEELPHRGYKDFMDVLSLADCNNVDLRSDKIRELCEKFGSRKIYERILAFKG
jgi:predicted nucleotidyltransferase